MNATPKPGWKTTEFWVGLIAQILSLFALIGVIDTQHTGDLLQALTQIITAIFALVANAAVVVAYIQARTDLKVIHLDNGQPPPEAGDDDDHHNRNGALLSLLLPLGLLFLSTAPASAQSKPPVLTTSNCFCHCTPQRTQNGDTQAMMRLLERIAAQNEQIIAMLQMQQMQQQFYARQQLPIQGQPLQQLPVQGAPLQQLPTQGQPLQPLPSQGQPLQPLAPTGQPRQTLPLSSNRIYLPDPERLAIR